jgi:hypothetical protein
MADEARLNEILDIIEQARAEGDAATEAKATAAYKRESAPPVVEAAPSIGGGMPMNPMVPRFMAGAQKVNDTLGVTAENTRNPIANAAGPLETLAQAGTGFAGLLAGGFAGIGQGIKNQFSPGMQAGDRVRQVQDALTYQPRTGMGQGFSSVTGLPGAIYDAGSTKAGEVVTDVTGSPAAGSAVKTGLDVMPWSAAARALPKRGPRGDYTPRAERPLASSAELKTEADAAYKASDAAGVVIRPESTQRVVAMLDEIAETENLGKLPPKMKEARDILTARIEAGKALSLRDADKVRQLINDAKKSTDAADQRLASVAQERYDAYIDGLGANDTLAGNTAQGVAMLKEARDLHRRRRNAELFEQIDEIAETKGSVNYTQAGESLALRQKFAAIANNPRELRKYSPEEQAAIKQVARGTAAENTLRNLGKIDPSRGGMAQGLNTIIGGGLGGALGSLAGPAGAGAGAVGGMAALGVGANLANRKALSMTRRNVEKARATLTRPSGGLLAKDTPTPLTVERQGLLGPAKAQSVESIRSDIQALTAEVERLSAMGPQAATVRGSVEAELARLQQELKAAEARGGSP